MRPLTGPVLTAAEMRAAEVASGVPLTMLMERAGSALAQAVYRFSSGRPILVVCGPGNNGGDGYVAARRLAEQGADVRVAALGSPASDLAGAARDAWPGAVEALATARPAPVLVDALFGTGMSRPLAAEYREPLMRLSAAAAWVVAADLPSGVGSDDGADLGAIAADLTLAFGAAKPAHLLQPAAQRCKLVLIADIGVDAVGMAAVLARPRLRAPGFDDHKYTRGMVAVVGGELAGAATLSVSAAARLAGYSVLCGSGDAPAAVVRRGFAETLGDPRLGAMLIGPGLAKTSGNQAMLDAALASEVALVLDAGALDMMTLAQLDRAAPTILTPHAGEFAKLFGADAAGKLGRTRDAAQHLGATIVFKGSDTVIASPDQRATLSLSASAWLASAGTGDVLAGAVAAMLACGLGAHEAACAGVWLHGEAARLAGPALIADDLIVHLSAALAVASR